MYFQLRITQLTKIYKQITLFIPNSIIIFTLIQKLLAKKLLASLDKSQPKKLKPKPTTPQTIKNQLSAVSSLKPSKQHPIADQKSQSQERRRTSTKKSSFKKVADDARRRPKAEIQFYKFNFSSAKSILAYRRLSTLYCSTPPSSSHNNKSSYCSRHRRLKKSGLLHGRTFFF